jgi:hypothetical protein
LVNLKREISMSQVSRRSFLGMAGAAAAFAPLGLRALESRQDKVILGDGKHKYEWVKNWLKLPAGVTLSSTHGCVAVDSKDRIYFNTDNENSVIIVEADGTFVKSWGKDFKGGSHGMTIAKDGDKEVLWLSHTGRSEVVKCTLDGEVLMTIPFPEKSGVYKAKNEYRPTSVAIAPNGDVYVGDGYGKHHVHQWNAKGEYIRSWNAADGAAGKFNTPHGVAIDTRGPEPKVIVADRGNGRLQIFTLDGKYVDVVKEGLRMPCKVYLRGDDILIPDLKGRITILGKDNKLIAHLGDNADEKLRGNFGAAPEVWKDGEFTAPHGAAWDSKGNAYVEDWNKTGRVSKLLRIG